MEVEHREKAWGGRGERQSKEAVANAAWGGKGWTTDREIAEDHEQQYNRDMMREQICVDVRGRNREPL
jgi:hypothetical protein